MNDALGDVLWTICGPLIVLLAFGVAQYSDYRTKREDECAARGMYWDQIADKCVEKRRRPVVLTSFSAQQSR